MSLYARCLCPVHSNRPDPDTQTTKHKSYFIAIGYFLILFNLCTSVCWSLHTISKETLFNPFGEGGGYPTWGMIPRVIKKLKQDKARAIMVLPKWESKGKGKAQIKGLTEWFC